MALTADDSWKKLDVCLAEALDLPEQERELFLEARLAGDDVAIREARRLLAQSRDAERLFSRSPVASLSGLGVGSRLGPWQLEKPLGAGGMGVVWLARRVDGQAEMLAAVKLLPPVFRASPALEERFQMEKQILARLQHPHIARLLDAGAGDAETPNFVMEYVDGLPLTTYLSKTGMDLLGRIRLFLKICDAVQYAHENLVIHRDLKPQNILTGANGEPKLLDFGIGKLLDSANAQATQSLAFSLDYASPEQIQGGRISTSSDVYSLGLVLYEVIAGEPSRQWSTLSLGEVVTASDRWIVPPLPDRDLSAICRKAAAIHQDSRYRSVSELTADLERWLQGRPVEARPAGPLYQAWCFARRNRAAVAGSTLAFGAIVTLGAWGWLAAGRAENERAAAIRSSKQLEVALAREQTALAKEVAAHKSAEAERNEAQRQAGIAREMQRQSDERFSSVLRIHQTAIESALQSVARLPGGTKASVAIIERALGRLSEVQPSNAGRPAFLALQAETYTNLADLYGGSNSNLGDREKYRANLHRSVELWSEAHRLAPDRLDYERGYLGASFAAELLDKPQIAEGQSLPAYFVRFEQDFKHLASKMPDAARSLGNYYFRRGNLRRSQQEKAADYKLALQWFSRNLDENNPNSTAARDAALMHKYLASTLTLQVAERFTHAGEAVRLDQRRVSLSPNDGPRKLDHAFSLSVLSDVKYAAKDFAGAKQGYFESFRIRKALAANDRDNIFVIRSLWYPLRWYTTLSAMDQDWQALRTALSEYDWIAAQIPKAKPSISDDIGITYYSGLLSANAGDRAAACASFERSHRIAAANPNAQPQWIQASLIEAELAHWECRPK
jgi:serine/threonine protein kinase